MADRENLNAQSRVGAIGSVFALLLVAACNQSENPVPHQQEATATGQQASSMSGATESGASAGFEKSFREQFAQSFVKSCESGAVRSGAPADKATAICACAADGVLEKYDVSELMTLSPEDTLPVTIACVQKNGGLSL